METLVRETLWLKLKSMETFEFKSVIFVNPSFYM